MMSIKRQLLVCWVTAALTASTTSLAGESQDVPETLPDQPVQSNAVPSQLIVGWVEKARVLPEKTTLKVKVDSGALTSSMHAVNIDQFIRGGKRWVRYDVPVVDAETGDKVTMHFEVPVYRRVLVRGAGGEDRRPVVKMALCIGDRVYEEQFSLRDRGDMNYPVLLGRRTISHIGLIDVANTFLLPLNCPPDADQQERDRLAELEADAALIDESRVDEAAEDEDGGSQEYEE
ncbi:retropepsin-like aspartic peptidase RloA3 [Halopseudomonas salegens]|uniref:Uncharacterized conserved protein n=1 Tax=Halopseudomonas salegens TaxID=1434072 RepID=A0A1H2EUF2_9GAMM|nr:ATP-dependent zinc protease [Halopseudomonas salegens]SDT98679.1 Uncharacterized conserved protein [Halopseudomonas salegens]